MSSLNKVQLIGNLGRDPEIRSTQNGNRVANLSIATSDVWRDKQSGERRERTEWHRIVCFNDHLVDIIEKYCAKGDKVYLEGALQTRKWTDQQGVEKYTTEIVMQKFDGKIVLLGGKNGGSDEDENQDQRSGRSGGVGGGQQQQDDLDDDIPF